MGSSSGLPCSEASSFARWTASCALTVNLSQRIAMEDSQLSFCHFGPGEGGAQSEAAKCIGPSLRSGRQNLMDDKAVWMTKRFVQPNYFSKENGRRLLVPPPAKDCRALPSRGGRMRPPLRKLTYAALLGPLLSRVFSLFSLPTLTLICLGLASAFLGKLIFNTPFS